MPLLAIRVRILYGTSLALRMNQIGHFENRLRQLSRGEVFETFFEITIITRPAFVDIYYIEEELNTSDMAEEKLLSRLYDEVTHILQRIHTTIGLVTWIQPNAS